MTLAATKTKHSFADLEKLYKEAEETDAAAFAEMRSNVLLIAGDHYAKKGSKLWNRIKDAKGVTDEQKIRLTKNHIQRIVKTYSNNITSYAPGVAILPRSDSEMQDQKASELHSAVWNFGKDEMGYDERVSDWADDFNGIGEVATKCFWDKGAGPILGFKAKQDPSSGQDLYKHEDGSETTDGGMHPETGQATRELVPGEPIFRGALVLEDIYGFDLLRPKGCKALSKAPWLGVRKMVDMTEVLSWVKGDQEKEKLVKADENKTYVVFDTASSEYGSEAGKVLIKEYYFRPCYAYPRGWYYITTSYGILFEGELPFGVFPIEVQVFDKVQTSPRGRAIVKVLRPYQIEINRSASKMAEHQITLGDDKVLVQKGTQLSQGGALPGVRGVTYTGKEPVVLAGRDGSQYLNYMNSQISEMYDVAMVREDSEEKGQMDPMSMLFRSASQKKKFSRYTKRFESFLIRVCKLYLRLAKEYFDESMIIPAIGRDQTVNIAEFKNADDICYQIKLEAQSDDVETKFGKMFEIQQALQYVGSKMSREDIGKLMRAMPYANKEESFSDFTLEYDSATNVLLALDRGQQPAFNKHDNHPYMIQRLVARQRKSDYNLLSPMIQQAYDARVAQHEAVMAEQARAQQEAEAGFIPTDGYMVVVDLYVSDPKDPNKTKRARLPYSSVLWLIKRLESQGLAQDALEGIDGQSRSDIARMTGPGMNAGAPNGMGMPAMANDMARGAGNERSSQSGIGGFGAGSGGRVSQPAFRSNTAGVQ